MVLEELSGYSDFEIHGYCVEYDWCSPLAGLALEEDSLYTSAKMEYIRTILPDLHKGGHRVLLFSQVSCVLATIMSLYIFITRYASLPQI